MDKYSGYSSRGAARLGLVCITRGEEIRYHTITRTRYRALATGPRERWMRNLYQNNLDTLFRALLYCKENRIKLYRVPSDLFPMNDYALGQKLLAELAPRMRDFGVNASRLGIRIVLHPDQFVVLSSESKKVVANSMGIMENHTYIFDLLGLPRSPWASMNLHGGKRGRHEALKEIISTLPESIHARLTLENDEYSYGAEEILNICRTTGIPMAFDIHHHVVKEKLSSYEHPSIAKMQRAARATWPQPGWQIIHISNGEKALHDSRHSEIIRIMPRAALKAPWIEVEAKGKENAIEHLRTLYPALR
jgi:UV DNA damage endonuclease